MSVVRVEGRDAGAFLHAQLTSNVRVMTPGEIRLSAWCTPAGRVLHLFWILARPDDAGFDLIAPSGEAEGLLERLRRFVLRSKVELRNDVPRVQGVFGDGAREFVETRFGEVPASGKAIVSEGRLAGRPPGRPRRYLLYGRGLEPPIASSSPRTWPRLEIDAGIAWLADGSREAFLPQMLNLDRLGAVSFDKGCYPGQEVIARTRYLGQVKRRLFRASAPAGAVPPPGSSIRAGGRSAGTVVAAEPDPDGISLLAVVQVELAAGALTLEDDRPVTIPRDEYPVRTPG